MLGRHELRWIARPAILTFVITFAIAVTVGLIRSKPTDMVLGVSTVFAAALALLVSWQIIAFKRGRIAAAAYRDVLIGGAGAVIIDKDGNPIEPTKRRRKKRTAKPTAP